jgi:histidinol-phosphate aminotransferase
MSTRIDRRRFVALGAAGATLAAPLDAVARKATRGATAELTWPIRLAGNENPWGPGPAARAALAASVGESCRYGMAAYAELAEAIAKREGVDKDRVIIGSGSGELLHMLAVSWCDRGQLVCAWPTFGQLMAYAEKFGCEIRRVPVDAQLGHDLPALAAAVTPNTSLLYLCNPNNPTGTVVAAEPLRAFAREMQRQALVVVDEAYLELADPLATGSLVDLVRENLNVCVLRTFSKIHGLAGLRVGYGIAPQGVIQRLRRYSMTTPSTLSLRAATASLGDTAWLAQTRATLLADRQRLCDALQELGIACAKPQGNFVFANVRMPSDDFRRKLAAERIEVGRTFEPLKDWSRITVGTTAETTALIDALRRVLRT